MQFKDISIDDKDTFQKFFNMKNYGISEFTFTNLYIWKHECDIKYSMVNDFLCITGVENKVLPFWFMPVGTGDLGVVLDKLISHNGQRDKVFIKSASSEMRDELEKARPGIFRYEPIPDLYDYIYLQQDLEHLPGKKYHSKRNHINKFDSLYSSTQKAFSSELSSKCMETAIEWFEKRDNPSDLSLSSEKIAVSKIITDFDALDIKGEVLIVEDKIVAFSFGEMLTPDTAVIHIEKANTDYEGSYTVINRNFCKNAFGNAMYLNREEDMGIEGLRKAKSSYNPVKLIEKFHVYLK